MIVAFGYMGVADSGTTLNEILGDRRLQVFCRERLPQKFSYDVTDLGDEHAVATTS